jgi:hypothetical protein
MSAISIPWGGRDFAGPRTSAAATPRMTNLAFGAVAGGLGVLTLLLVLMINVATTQGAFEEAGLKGAVRSIEAAQQRAQQTLAMLASPGNLESRARAMGMVPVASPVFLRLADAKVIGKPEAATYQASPTSVQLLMPTESVMSPDLETAPAAKKSRMIPPTSDAAVEIVAGQAP